MARRGLLAAAAVVVVLSASACGNEVPPPPAPIVATTGDHGMELELHLPRDRFDADEVIAIDSTLTWTGAAPKQSVWHGDPGPVVHSLAQADGRLVLGAAVNTICASTELTRGVPLAQPYVKSLGWSDDDPDAALYRAFAADPLLHLSPGRWRVTAEVDGFLAPCDAVAPPLQLRAQAEFEVE